jgi:hypothetical protein
MFGKFTNKDGKTYYIADRRVVTEGKNFGKIFFDLKNEDGEKFIAMTTNEKALTRARITPSAY